MYNLYYAYMKNGLGGVIGFGKKPHKTRSQRKIITLQEWANYVGLSRQTVDAYLKAYQKIHDYDPRDIYSVLDFFQFLLPGKSERKEA
jgi:Fic family protein